MTSGRVSLPNGIKVMDESLKIECGDWWGPANGENDIFQATRAPIGISVGEQWLTRLEDSWGNTVRSRLNGCAYTLASWFAGNWWRLRWEPETPSSCDDVDWRMSHSMASAGDGYCWPSILFASDGESIALASRATKGPVMGSVRYLNEVSTRITAKEFERAVDAFMSLVLSRLQSEDYGKNDLEELWGEIMNERQDPKLTRLRKLEALCGYDPDEAPSSVIKKLVNDESRFGTHALEEVAAYGRHNTVEVLKQIQPLAALKKPGRAGIRATLPDLSPTWKKLASGDRPWQRASIIAKKARQEWGLGSGPIPDRKLAELVKTSASAFTKSGEARTKIPVAFRRGNNNEVDLFFHSLRSTGRRFAVGRLLGDHCSFVPSEHLIPETEAKTSRQQFQRAFAQEFLCPLDALRDKIKTRHPDQEDIAEAADYFHVSPLMVRTTLVNNGELDREALAWAD